MVLLYTERNSTAEIEPMRNQNQPARIFKAHPARTYIVLNKPFQVLCQFTPEGESSKRTLAEFGFPKNVYPVGRLDYDSEGLLILTDDGRLTDALLNPRHGHNRTYLAQVERIPSNEALETIARGVVVEGKKTLPAEVELLEQEPTLPERNPPIRFRKNVPTAWIQLSLREGRNRQVRKMTAAIGHPTLRLVRISIGALKLFELALEPGHWRVLNTDQVDGLFKS